MSNDVIPLIAELTVSYSTAQTVYNTTYNNTSTYPFPSPTVFSSCNGATEGACNSSNILAFYNATYNGINYITTNYSTSCDRNQSGGTGGCSLSAGQTAFTDYAAGRCANYVIDSSGNTPCQVGNVCYENWYLPSICEMGYDTNAFGNGCGIPPAPPTIQNIQSNLVDNSIVNLTDLYWSSTEYSPLPQITSWIQVFSSSGGSQGFGVKYDQLNVRCSRAF